MTQHAIFLNGERGDIELVRAQIGPQDYIIGVDGGSEHVLSLDLLPNVVIGDCDSLSLDTIARLESSGVPFVRHDPYKDETDLELALIHSLERSPSKILIVSALGGRLDHLLGNAFILADKRLQGVPAELVEGIFRMSLLYPGIEHRITGTPGETFSLLPFASDVRVRRLKGSEWELTDTPLPLGSGRGLSNIFRNPEVRIELESGMLLLVVTRLLSNASGV